jgi:hypothetical protein
VLWSDQEGVQDVGAQWGSIFRGVDTSFDWTREYGGVHTYQRMEMFYSLTRMVQVVGAE